VQANKIQRIPALKIQEVIVKSTFPEFTRIADNPKKTLHYFSVLFKNSLAINLPVLICLILFSSYLVPLLLTDKWIPIIPYIQLVCMASLFLPFYALCSNIVLSKGLSFLNLEIEALKKACIVASIAVTIHWGIIGLIVGQIIS